LAVSAGTRGPALLPRAEGGRLEETLTSYPLPSAGACPGRVGLCGQADPAVV